MIAFGIAGYWTYNSNQKLFREEMSKQISITNQEALAKLELRVQEMKRISQTIVFNPEIEEMIRRYNEYRHSDRYRMYLEMGKIDDLINQLKSDAPYITGLYMFDLSGQSVYYRYNTPSIETLNTSTFRSIRTKIEPTSGELVWMNMPMPSSIEPTGMRNTIVAARWMKNSQLQKYGILVVMIDESLLSSNLKELMKDGQGKVFLFNRRNELLYSNDKLVSKENLDEIRQQSDNQVIGDYLFVRNESVNRLTDSFLLVSAKSMNGIKARNKELFDRLLLTGLLIALITSLSIAFAMKRLLRPIGDLLSGLQRLRSGKFETRIAVRSNDEIAFIGESFNAMAQHVEQLIKKVYLTQLSERDAELKALQSQLNPHFLHNFFNEIYWKLEEKGDNDTAELIAAVAGMLRHSLMPVRLPTTVREEIAQIQNYVKVQAELFETELSFKLDVEDSVLGYEMMRALFQPLVENVFMHAFRNKISDKLLHVKVWRDDDFLRIDITDNGCGMAKSLQGKLLDEADMLREDDGGRRESLGVRSVARRIELLYGTPFRMEMDSELNVGTRIRIYLPARQAS